MSSFLTIVIGATTVADAVAVAGACAEAVAEKAIDNVTIAIIEVIFFIIENDLKINYPTK
jgi:hypothetical protein